MDQFGYSNDLEEAPEGLLVWNVREGDEDPPEEPYCPEPSDFDFYVCL